MENELFDEMYKVETQHWWLVARRKIIASIIDTFGLGLDSKIMDAGCGNGDNLEFLSQYGELIAIEMDDNALARAQSRQIGKVVKGELPDNFPSAINRENDLIVLLDVLEHINDDEKSLSILKNWAKSKGKLLITVPAYQFLWTKHDELHHHKRRYTVGQLKKIIENNGWNVNYISYFNSFLFPLALIARLKDKVFPPAKIDSLTLPNRFINHLFEKIFSLETIILRKFSFPFGLSIIVVAEKE
jgi:SAM-dependent methyltransferase